MNTMLVSRDSIHPDRRKPAHPVPVERWNQPVVLMVTVGLRKPNAYHCLNNATFQNAIVAAWERSPEWHVGLFMVMPDHIHLFCVPGLLEPMLVDGWVRKWKSFATTAMGRPNWRWLPGCWDTQMRTKEQYEEKRAYVGMNPVRKGLARTAEEWPFQGEMNRIVW